MTEELVTVRVPRHLIAEAKSHFTILAESDASRSQVCRFVLERILSLPTTPIVTRQEQLRYAGLQRGHQLRGKPALNPTGRKKKKLTK